MRLKDCLTLAGCVTSIALADKQEERGFCREIVIYR